jgi:hypothetical protein
MGGHVSVRDVGRRAGGIAIAAALWLAAGVAAAGPDWPDPAGSAQALVLTPFRVAGDVVGAVGLSGACVIGLAGDGVSLVDANPLTRPVLRGVASGAVRRVALGLSQGSTGFMEGLRGEDVERLPEPPAAYLENAPGIGRLDTFLSSLGALRLALDDALGGPTQAVLRLVGARAAAERVERFQREERIRVLGPLVRETGLDAESATLGP